MNTSDSFVVAVDGGGTGCRVAICDGDGAIVARASGPAANVASNFHAALDNLRAAIDAARNEAGLSPARLAACPAWLGLAGAIDPGTCARAAEALPFAHARVSDDRPTGMAGALGGADGCLVATGTGSFLGRQADGARRYVGGWGLQVSDQASGSWLGRRLLAALVDWHDNMGPGSPLLDEVLADFGSVAAAVFFSLEATPTDFARYAPRIAEAAQAGDVVARRLLADGAHWIAAGLRAMGAEAGEPVCLIGGIGPHYADYLPPEFAGNLIAPRGSSLDGAVRLALELRETVA